MSSAAELPRARAWPGLLLPAVAGPIMYGAGLWACWLADGRPAPAECACFRPGVTDGAPLRAAAAATMAAGAMLLLWGAPWLAGAAACRCCFGRRRAAWAWSLAVNSAALPAICCLLRATGGVNRWTFLAAWLAWTAVLLAISLLPPGRPGSLGRPDATRWAVPLVAGLLVVVAGAALFHREHFRQCFNGDGSEFEALAGSLRHHLVPYWEIEPADRFGTFVANPTVINSYWTLGLQLLLGSGEVSTRLPYWVWWLGIFLVGFQMVGGEGGRGRGTVPIFVAGRHKNGTVPLWQARGQWMALVPLALLVLLSALWYTFYVGYDPYAADLANPGVPDAMFTLLTLLALDCLRRGDAAGWVAMAVCAALLFYAGFVMFALVAAAALVWRPLPRRQLWRAAAAGTAVLAAIVLAYLAWGWHENLLPAWRASFGVEWLGKYFDPSPRLAKGLSCRLYAGYYLLGCGGIAALGPILALLPRRGEDAQAGGWLDGPAWDRTAASVVILYLLIIFGSGNKNLHYLGPLLPVTLVLWLRRGRGTAGAKGGQSHFCGVLPQKSGPSPGGGAALLAALGLAASVWLCWPRERPTFTLNRQLGQMTTFQTDSYETACYWGRIADDLYRRRPVPFSVSCLRVILQTLGCPPRVTQNIVQSHRHGLMSWQVSQHTWVGYAERRAAQPALRPLLVAPGPAPPGYQLVYRSPGGVNLYSRGPQPARWLMRQQPSQGPDRCPWVFQPIALKDKG